MYVSSIEVASWTNRSRVEDPQLRP